MCGDVCFTHAIIYIFFIKRGSGGRLSFAPNAQFARFAQFADGNMKENLRRLTKDLERLFRKVSIEKGICPMPPICDKHDPYRTADGSCNNLYSPLLGRALVAQKRLIDNAYDDSM